MNIEPLEPRIAPASLTFTDVDGDDVIITVSKGTLTLGGNVIVVGGQLRTLDLSAAVFQGVNVSIVATRDPVLGGDGLVNVGHIAATGVDLGTVLVDGDLGDVDCGDATTSSTALKSLTVRSIGLFGLATQGGLGDLESNIAGPLGKLVVKRDIAGATIYVNAASDGDIGSATVGSATVGGSILGGDASNGGQIQATGELGPVKIGGDLVGGTGFLSGVITASRLASVTVGGSVVGGPGSSSGGIFGVLSIGNVKIGGDLAGVGFQSGRIFSLSGGINSVTIAGSVLAGDFESASIFASTGLGPVKIGEDVIGGPSESAQIFTDGGITSVKIGGSLVGGAGGLSGVIRARDDIGPVTIGGDFRGAGENSGKIVSSGRLLSLTIGGSLIGGTGNMNTLVLNGLPHQGQVYALEGIGPVKIAGDIIGGSGIMSASIEAGLGNDSTIAIGTLTIGGSILGGPGAASGRVLSAGSIGAVKIGGNLGGGTGDASGSVGANGAALASLSLGGSLIGGGTPSDQGTGFIFSRGDMGAVAIRGDVLGGIGEDSGSIVSFGNLASVTIGGSLVGGSGNSSGSIFSTGTLGSVKIAHDLFGGSIPGGVVSLFGSGSIISQDRIRSIVIGGSIIAGVDDSGNVVDGSLISNATIRAARSIDSITVRGDIVGNVTPFGDSAVIISAGGRVGNVTDLGPSEIAIGKITIGGRVEWAKILAGYDTQLTPVNADAQIGTVRVGADWVASSLVAGSENLGADNAPGGSGSNADNVNFGNIHDAKIAEATENPTVDSRIASIAIAGRVFGTPESVRPADSFGFVAEEIGAIRVGGRVFALQPDASNDGFTIARRSDAVLNDATLHEVNALFGFTLPVGAAPRLVNASTVTYTDADGDRVTVKLSKPLLTPANVNDVFTFSSTIVGNPLPVLQQLQTIDLTPLATHGIGVTVTVAPGGPGDGLAHVGAIHAVGFDIGKVVVPGDLGQLVAGAGAAGRPGVVSLEVRTLGRLDSDAIESGGQQVVLVTGGLGSLKVGQDIAGTAVNVTGSIGPVTIGGSLIGDDVDQSARISATGTIGAVKIGHHVQGGFGQDSGTVSGLRIASGAVGGSILGGAGLRSGQLDGNSELGPVLVAHNVSGGTGFASGQIIEPGRTVAIGGSLLGGRGEGSAQITREGLLGSVSVGHNVAGTSARQTGYIIALDMAGIAVGGSLIGSAGEESGTIESVRGSAVPDADIGLVKIGGDMLGGDGLRSGGIFADGKLGGIAVGGSLLGGSGERSGRVESQLKMGAVTIDRNLQGGAGPNSGAIRTPDTIASVAIGGSLGGGTSEFAGIIIGTGGLGAVKVRGDVAGGTMNFTGFITADNEMGPVSVGGSLIGRGDSVTFNSGSIYCAGNLDSVTIAGSVVGGTAVLSGWIEADFLITSVTVGGSISGGTGSNSGAIFSGLGDIGTVQIGRNIIGGSASVAASLSVSGYIESDESLAGVTVGGTIFAGWDTSSGTLQKSGSIRAGDDLVKVVIRGSMHGNATSPIIISGRGEALPLAVPTRDLAIENVSVGGSVERAFLLGGASVDLDAVNGNAQIGPIRVGGDWVASSISAGVAAGGDGFGNSNDALIAGASPTIIARIASIQIGGLVAGSAIPGDHFGFVAEQIGAFKSLGIVAALTAAKDVPIELSPVTGDVTIREV